MKPTDWQELFEFMNFRKAKSALEEYAFKKAQMAAATKGDI